MIVSRHNSLLAHKQRQERSQSEVTRLICTSVISVRVAKSKSGSIWASFRSARNAKSLEQTHTMLSAAAESMTTCIRSRGKMKRRAVVHVIMELLKLHLSSETH